MRREAPRTLYTLSADYQLDVRTDDYDVIVVDNGSAERMSSDEVKPFGPNFHYHYVENALPSPAAAINLGVTRSRAQHVGVMIDGARMASPGIVRLALKALDAFERPVVGTVAFHIGPDQQPRSVMYGYGREAEDELLARIDWRRNGYRLFDISTVANSSSPGRLGKIADRIAPPVTAAARTSAAHVAETMRAFASLLESNLIFMPAALFHELRGYDERFDLPGGGLVNLDFYRRAADLPNTTLVTLSGEATFHQVHGGTMTNTPVPSGVEEIRKYETQFEAIRGVPFEPSRRVALVVGWPSPARRGQDDGCGGLERHVDPSSVHIKLLTFMMGSMRRLLRPIRRRSAHAVGCPR